MLNSKKTLLIVFLLLLSGIVLAQPKYGLKVIVVGIGEKNPTFDESKFQNLEFYYTPGLVSKAEVDETGKAVVALLGEGAREIFEGTPELLAKWWDDRDLRGYAILFDKNGVGTWQGHLRQDDVFENNGYGAKEDNLKDALETLIEDQEFAQFDTEKKFNFEDKDCLIETKIPDFEIASLNGEKKSIKTVVENGNTTLLVFFQISKDVDINAAKSSEKEEGLGSFLSGITKSAAGSKWSDLFKNLEFYIFDNNVKL